MSYKDRNINHSFVGYRFRRGRRGGLPRGGAVTAGVTRLGQALLGHRAVSNHPVRRKIDCEAAHRNRGEKKCKQGDVHEQAPTAT